MKMNWKVIWKGLGAVWLTTGLAAAYVGRSVDPLKEFNLETPAQPQPDGFSEMLRLGQDTSARDPRGPVDEIYSSPTPGAPKPAPIPPERRQYWVEFNADYFRKFRAALAMPISYPLPAVQVGEDSFNHYALRNNADFLAVESHMHTVAGRHALAVASLLDAWEAALKVQKNAPLTGALNGMAMEAKTRSELSPAIAYLNGREAATAAARVERILELRPPIVETWKSEKHFRLMTFKRAVEVELYTKKKLKEHLARTERGELVDFDIRAAEAREVQGPFINWTVRRLLNGLAQAMDGLISTAGGTWNNHTPPPVLNPDPYKFNGMLQKWGEFRFHHAMAQVRGNLILTRLALHAYRKDNGRYPQSLSQLVPRYLKQVPQDPFSDGKPLHYIPTALRYKLWSVGPDGRSDNAKPITSRNFQGEVVYTVKKENLGDVVAGFNDASRLRYRIMPGGTSSTAPESSAPSGTPNG